MKLNALYKSYHFSNEFIIYMAGINNISKLNIIYFHHNAQYNDETRLQLLGSLIAPTGFILSTWVWGTEQLKANGNA
jgi:hypothetical protein